MCVFEEEEEITDTGGAHNWSTVRAEICRRFMAFICYWLIGSSILYFLEPNWTAIDSVYFGIVTVSSVGYGDMVLSKPSSRVFGVLFALFGVFGTVAALGQCADKFLTYKYFQRVKHISCSDLESLFDKIDIRNSGSIDRTEFLVFMLVSSGKIRQQDADIIMRTFDALDSDKSGSVSRAQIQIAMGQPWGTANRSTGSYTMEIQHDSQLRTAGFTV